MNAKKILMALAILIAILSRGFAADTGWYRDRDIEKNNLKILAQKYPYTLCEDKNGTFFLYHETYSYRNMDWDGHLSGRYDCVDIYRENGQVSKTWIENKARESGGGTKLLDGDYSIFSIAYTYKYIIVKTPKGNFFRVDKWVDEINIDMEEYKREEEQRANDFINSL